MKEIYVIKAKYCCESYYEEEPYEYSSIVEEFGYFDTEDEAKSFIDEMEESEAIKSLYFVSKLMKGGK